MEKKDKYDVFRAWDVVYALRETATNGFAHIPGVLNEHFLVRLQAEIQQGSLDSVEIPGVVNQKFERLKVLSNGAHVPYLEALRIATGDIISGTAEEFPELRNWRVYDAVVQKYTADANIGSHQDHSCNRGVVVIFTVAGSGVVEILGGERNGSVIAAPCLTAGDCFLLRAPGLAGSSAADRLFHRVLGTTGTEPRISVVFRDDGGKHGHYLYP